MRISLSPIQKLYYSNDGLVFLTNNNGKTIRQVQFNEEMFERLYSLPMIYKKKILDYLNKPVNDNANIVKPDRSDGEYLYFIMDDGTELRVNMDTLNGLGILPNGEIIVGYGKNNPQYYYDLLVLREKYTETKDEKSNERALLDIAMDAWNRIRNEYPEDTDAEINKKYMDAWRDIPDDYYQINDVTDEINNIIESYLNDSDWKEVKGFFILDKLLIFYNEVKKEAPIDLKNQDEWEKHPLYIYDGEILDVDALGNILYGVLGAYLDIDIYTLFLGASAAQTWDNKKFMLDDPRDIKQWKQGIKLYYDKYYEGD